MKKAFLPLTAEEVRERGWANVDIVLITGDAYVDHPSFGIAVIGRMLEAAGFTVALLSQPDWHSAIDFQKFGKPNLFFGISAGNMDSMVNMYTSLKKRRNNDAYSTDDRPLQRPDRATIVYAQRARQAYRDVPIILGGVEASLRRFAHYDYWSDKIRRSILLDAKADLLVYGMGEYQIVEIANRLKSGNHIHSIRDIRGTLFCLRKNEHLFLENAREIPSYEEVLKSKEKFNRATEIIYRETNPFNAKPIIQRYGNRSVIGLPPPLPLSETQLDYIYELPYTRKPHPIYEKRITAYEMIKHSVTIMRGCFGGCSFCSIVLHQGRFIQSRSQKSILREIASIASSDLFRGTISDLGGPTANLYKIAGKEKMLCFRCEKLSCIYPQICKNLDTNPSGLMSLMKKSRTVKGVHHVFISSGIRMDVALLHPEYIRELARYHVSGYLKVAPEHISKSVLQVMRKPQKEVFESFQKLFMQFSKEVHKEQYIIPYIISAHPGSDLRNAAELALFLKRNGYRPRQIQDFLPAPMAVATSLYYTCQDPITGKRVHVTVREAEKRVHRAIIQYFKPENREIIIAVFKKLKMEKRIKELIY